MKKALLIAIAGGSASGKTSIAMSILKHFNNKRIYILKQDDYYKDHSLLNLEQRKEINYDHPLAFDDELMIEQINDLVNYKAIFKPVYNYLKHTRYLEKEKVEPVDVVIVEGLFVLENIKLRELFDLKVFIDTDADIRLIRRINRDIDERGRSLKEILKQYQTSVREMHIQFIEPTKKYADVIIPMGKENVVATDLIITKISSILEQDLL